MGIERRARFPNVCPVKQLSSVKVNVQFNQWNGN